MLYFLKRFLLAFIVISVIVISTLITLLINIYAPATGGTILEEGSISLISNYFIINIDIDKGNVYEIFNPYDRFQTNFVGNNENHEFIQKGLVQPLGEICIKYRILEEVTWRQICLSELHAKKEFTVRKEDQAVIFTYEVKGQIGKELSRLLILEKKYFIDKNGEFLFEITIKNVYSKPIEIGELSLPLSFNLDCWSQDAYDRNVLLHPFVSGHSSYIYVVRPNGIPPILLVTPEGDTYFEAITGQWSLGVIKQPPPVLYLHAKANEDLWKKWFYSYTSAILDPWQNKIYTIRFSWIDKYEDIPTKLYSLGKVVAEKIIPGMVVPLDLDVYMVLKSKKIIKEIYVDEYTELNISQKDADTYIVKLKFNSLGQHVVHIYYGNNEWTSYPFYAIENIEQLLKKRADFIIKYQRITDPNDIRQYAFLMWDSENKTVLDSAPPLLDFGSGWPRPPRSWMNGGSDEIGFAEPLTLAIKNLYYPNEDEIKALEEYIWNFLYGKLQDKNTFGVKRWIWDDPPPGYWRSFNYPHVFSLYYTMYKIAKYYPRLVNHTPQEYLLLAYKTAMAFHNDQLVGSAWRYIAHMNQWTLLEILDALREEGFKKEYTMLLSYVKLSSQYFISKKYVYLSEFPFDTTAYETVYFYRKWRGRYDLVNSTVYILLATLRQVPIWWWYGADIKGIGTYTTAENARALLDAYETYFRGSGSYIEELTLRIGYAGILGYLSNLHPTGEATTGPDWSPDGAWGHYFNSKWSNEYGIGLYSLGYALKSYVVKDLELGTICYGCKVIENDTKYVIIPYDGIRTRILVDPTDIELEIEKGHITKLEIEKSKEKITLIAEKAHPTVEELNIIVKGVRLGKYDIYVDGELVKTVEVTDNILRTILPIRKTYITIEIVLYTHNSQ